MQYRLETDRLILRTLELTDAPDIQRLINHPQIARNTLSVPYPYPDGLAEKWIREQMMPAMEEGTDFVFAITLRKTGEFMGVLGMHDLNEHKRIDVGYWLGEVYWGKGYATEALRRAIQFGFEELDVNRIYAEFFTFNTASRRVMEKSGMTFEGVHRQNILKNGEYIDDGVCAILREDYEATR